MKPTYVSLVQYVCWPLNFLTAASVVKADVLNVFLDDHLHQVDLQFI